LTGSFCSDEDYCDGIEGGHCHGHAEFDKTNKHRHPCHENDHHHHIKMLSQGEVQQICSKNGVTDACDHNNEEEVALKGSSEGRAGRKSVGGNGVETM